MRRFRFAALAPVLLLFVLFGYVLYPLATTISESVHINGRLSLVHYFDLLNPANTASWEAVWNSVYVSFLSVLCSGLVGVLFAFVLTQMDFPLKNTISRLVVLPIALPPLVGVISFLFVFGESGILPRIVQLLIGSKPFGLDGISAIVVVHTYSFYVYFYLFVSTALRQLDSSLLEAASGLGGSAWNNFRRVILPELRPALTAASILTFMASMASFSAPFLFGGEKRFMTLQIYSSKLNGELSTASAQAVGLTVVSVAFFVVLRMSANASRLSRRNRGAVKSRPIEVGRRTKRLLIGVCVLTIIFEILPLLTIALISLAKEGSWTWQILPTAYTFDNYLKLFSDPHVFDPIRNSLLMTLVTLIAALIVGVSAAYFVTKGRSRTSKTMADVLVTLPFAVPGTVVAFSLILAFSSPNFFSGYKTLIGTFWILPLAYFVRTFPLIVRSTSASLEQMDDSLMEAGQTFGAGLIMRFRKIALPLILPGIVSGSMLVMIAALGEFVSSILLYTYSSRPISVEILSQLRTYNFGAASAYCVFLLVLVLTVISAANRLLTRHRHGDQAINF